jgi:hypothetical protein
LNIEWAAKKWILLGNVWKFLGKRDFAVLPIILRIPALVKGEIDIGIP